MASDNNLLDINKRRDIKCFSGQKKKHLPWRQRRDHKKGSHKSHPEGRSRCMKSPKSCVNKKILQKKDQYPSSKKIKQACVEFLHWGKATEELSECSYGTMFRSDTGTGGSQKRWLLCLPEEITCVDVLGGGSLNALEKSIVPSSPSEPKLTCLLQVGGRYTVWKGFRCSTDKLHPSTKSSEIDLGLTTFSDALTNG